MDPDFWQQRWRDGRIGFHQPQVTPLLEQYWDAAGIPASARVLVPLAGKSLDLPWLAARGHRVLGVELSPIAVQQFFTEHGLEPRIHASASGLHHVAGDIEIILGDVFALEPGLIASCTGVYDRAALIALPPALRDRYACDVYGHLPAGCRGLLVTLEYPQGEKAGPPFSVHAPEVRARFGTDWTLDLFERRDILGSQPGFVAEGVSALHTSAWGLRRR
ncbi:thiopurine S-methyltransferase [Cognatiluteimonas telluris]|jgi:thiopurine S-methyltransferase|uniref:thiopurine S-methyltransferase n=1 Tax=Cognatiluteimonas telluris TaxID=1104775 RepID=UPI00140DA6B8|nr:thiopurine S-methyltransferase [Lysobacter telluris]